MVPEVIENSPRPESSSPPWVVKSCCGLHHPSSLFSLCRHKFSYAVKDSPPALLIHTVCSQSVTVPPAGSPRAFAHLLLLKEKLHHLPIKFIFQGQWEIGCSRLQSGATPLQASRRESGKEMGLSHKPAPSRLFSQRFSAKNVRGPKASPCVYHASTLFFGNTRRAKASGPM